MPQAPNRQGASAADTSLAPTRFHLVEGTVVSQHSGMNMYEVRPGLNTVSGITITCTTFDSAKTYKPGDTILYAELPAAMLNKVGPDSRISIIIGSYRPVGLKPDQAEKYPDINISPLPGYGFSADKLAGLFRNILQDRSPGRTMDTFGGDFTHASELGCFLHAGYSGAAMGASPMARLMFNALHDGGKMFTLLWEHDSMCHEEGHYPDLESYVFYRRRAIAASEATGAYDIGSYKYDTEKKIYTLVTEKQQGIFRNEELEGRLVDGNWQYWSMPEDSGDSEVRASDKSDKPMLGIISERRKYNGQIEVRTAKGFSLVKSLYVPVPRKLDSEDDLKEQDAQTEEWFDKHTEVREYASQLAASIESEIFEYNMLNFNQERMRKRPTHWKIHTRDQLKEEYNTDIQKAENNLEALPDTDPEYKPLNENELLKEDKAAGLNTRLNALEAMFKILDDGTVVFSDGHGSEIRMCRGNITVTCPGDMQLMPGRDMVTMTPRRHYQVTGGDTFIHSSKGSVNIKAEKNLATLSGNGGEGATLIENRATGDFSKYTWLKGVTSGDPINNGIMIKSRRGLGITAYNTYIGTNDIYDNSENGLERGSHGTIVIDACQGVLTTLGQNIYSRSSNETLICSAPDTGGTGSVMSVSPDGVSTFAEKMEIGVGIFAVGKAPKASLALNHLNSAGVTVKKISFNQTVPTFRLNGSMKMAGGDMSVSGNIKASNVSATGGAFGNASSDSGLSGGSGPSGIKLPDLAGNIGTVTSDQFKIGIEGNLDLYTGLGINNMSFFYPTTESLKLAGTRIYQARWQKMLLKSGGGAKWEETEVEAPGGTKTKVYPGMTGWTDELFVGLLDGGKLSKTALNGKYAINCSQIGGDYGG